jgi:hypothetical protein
VGQLPERLLEQLRLRAPEQLAQGVVHLQPAAVDRAEAHPDRRALERSAEALLRCTQLRVLLLELEQHGHLRAQHVRIDRLQDVVDRPRRVAARDLLGVGVTGCQEDHGGVLVAVAALDQLDGLEAVEARHAHVHHDHGEVVVQQALEGVLARGGGDHLTPERLQHGPERDQALGLVVDDEDRARAAHTGRFL